MANGDEIFKKILAITLRFEGGFTDNSSDPGGATNYGITLATLSAHRGHRVSKSDVRHLSVEEAGEIYRHTYWAPLLADKLPPALALCLFDFAVNSGPDRAVRTLQTIVRAQIDGKMGAQTLAAVEKHDVSGAVHALCDHRLAFMRGLRTFSVFGDGWTARVRAVLAIAAAWAAADEPHSHTHATQLMETEVVDPNEPTPAVAIAAPKSNSAANKLTPVEIGQAAFDAVAHELAAPAPAAEADSKPFWASQTIWGAIGAIGGGVAGLYFAWRSGDAGALTASLASIAGGIHAIVGRYRAVVPIR